MERIDENKLAIPNQRDPLVDILKGIGIISIVIGHSSPAQLPILNFKIGTFVYGYHIMIFMFILGFLFKKPSDSRPFNYIGKTIFGLGKLYITYSIIFTLLHNTFLRFNFISNVPLTPDNIWVYILSSVPFNSTETLLGAMWFIPMYVIAAIFFSGCFCFAEKTKCPIAFHIVFIFLFMTVGVMMHNNPPYYLYHYQTSILAVPICYTGYFAKKYWNVINKYITWYGGMLCAIALYLLVTSPLGNIELAANQIIQPHLFYPATLLGIYYCLALGKILCAFKYSNRLFAYIGKNSFHIMAMHFAALKLVDVIYGAITGAAPEVISVFPFAFNLWYIYYPIGVFLPLGIIELAKLLGKYVSKVAILIDAKLDKKLKKTN